MWNGCCEQSNECKVCEDKMRKVFKYDDHLTPWIDENSFGQRPRPIRSSWLNNWKVSLASFEINN